MTSQSGTLKFNGGDAYLMGLNKASLKTSQTAPQGRGQAAESRPARQQPACSLICLWWRPAMGQVGRPCSCQSQVRACGLRGAALSLLTLGGCLRSGVSRDQLRLLAPFQEAPLPTPWEVCSRSPSAPLPSDLHTRGHGRGWKVGWRRP